MSGTRDDRPRLTTLRDYVRSGDTVVVVWKLDRLGRNMIHILQTVKELTDRGATLVSITDGIDSSTPAGRMMIGVLGSLAEYERELITERTALKRACSRPPPTGARAGGPARSTTPRPPGPAACGRRASRPPTSRRCWASPARVAVNFNAV